MSDASFDIPLVICGTGFQPRWFIGNIGFDLRPPGTDGAFTVREWPLGQSGQLFVTEGANQLAHLGIAVEPGATCGVVTAPTSATPTDSAHVTVPLASTVDVTSAEPVDDVQWHSVRLEGIDVDRWEHVADADLFVATDETGRLAALQFATRVRIPQRRAVRLRAEHGWRAETNQWFQTGSTGLSVSLSCEGSWLRTGSVVDHDHVPSLDGGANAVFLGDELASIDGMSTDGTVDLPPATAAGDEVAVTMTWPCPQLVVTLDASTEPARARFDFGPGPERWVSLGEELLVGIGSGDELAALVAPRLTLPDPMDVMHPPFDDMSQVEMMQHAAEQMSHHLAREREQAERYVAELPFAALGLADPPDVATCSMRMSDNPLGDAKPVGVQLTWGDDFGRQLPDGDRDAPVVTVVHERVIDLGVPASDRLSFDEHLGWLLGEEMTQRYWAAEASGDEAALMTMHDAHERRLQELADSATSGTLLVDGEQLDATVVRTEHAFVVRAERDGWRIVVRSTGVGPDIPDVIAIDELDPFLRGKADADARMVALHEDSVRQLEAAPPGPDEAVATRGDAERLARELQPDAHGFGRVPRTSNPTELFTAGIVEGWGGRDAFRQRFELTTRLVQLQPTVVAAARDGSVALLQVFAYLPRPDGNGVSCSVGHEGEWWDHDAPDLRTRAGQQLRRDKQGQYELRFHALVERQPDGSVAIATDLLRLIDEHVGGIQTLLTPPA